MTSGYPKFIYFSHLINVPVLDMLQKHSLGKVFDIVADVREMYPRITGLILKMKSAGKKIYIPWECIKSIDENRSLTIDSYQGYLENKINTNHHEILLRETFLDKQVVDISGSKLVRVNDLHILRDDLKLWLVHADVGFTGILRRLGWLTFFYKINRWLFSYDMKDKFIPWKHMHPVPTGEVKSVALKISQSKLSQILPADLADIIIELGPEERLNIFKSLDIKTAVETIQELPLKIGLQISEMLPDDMLVNLMDEVPIDEVVDILAEMENEKVNQVLKALPEDKANQIKDLMKHPERIAGSLMNPEFISAGPETTVGDALKLIKHEAGEIEFIYYLYIIDNEGRLSGVVTLKELLLSDPDLAVGPLIRRKVVSVEVSTHIKKVAQVFYKYNFMVVPVVDEDNFMKGIITMKDALETVFPEIREETEESK